jgi:hypothetical protein
VLEQAAGDLRSFLVWARAAEKLRTGSAEMQATVATALFAAIRESRSSIGSLSAAEMLSKFSLAIAPAASREN